ncbi:MAG TPA: tetratricopeptide repeat protein [Longimicrobiales bacterium]|nr:tetratricopeptide repeat protein [Longimicrobiales bacterium]
MRPRHAAAGALVLYATLALGSCAYFNELYNAKTAFEKAERAVERGERGTANQQYATAVEKAAKSVRRAPEGRWAGEALYLIGRSHFALGQHEKARAALERTLEVTEDRERRAGALTYLGAANLGRGRPAAAIAHLDDALSPDIRTAAVEPLARLWRARARFELGERAGAWEDLAVAARADGVVGTDARLEALMRSLEADDPARAAEAAAALALDERSRLVSDSIRRLVQAGSVRWGAAPARAMLLSLADAPWPPGARDTMALFRARLAAEAADTAAALADARGVLSASTGVTAEAARVLVARLLLASAEDVSELEPVRSVLLPALGNADARALVQAMKTVDVLIERGGATRQPLALFAAAELARDRLGAPALARRLFTAMVDMAPGTAYAGKGVLAALALAPSPAEEAALRSRVEAMEGNFYLDVAAGGGTPPDEFRIVEERLDRVLATMVSAAERDAGQRDALVVQTIAQLDSARNAGVQDTVAARCGVLIDSLGVPGVEGDSARAACLRADTLRLDSIAAGQLRFADPDARRRGPRTDTVIDTPEVALRPGAMPPAGHPVWSLLSPAP